eukprot:766844-Hanusia_phi.AAC.2
MSQLLLAPLPVLLLLEIRQVLSLRHSRQNLLLLLLFNLLHHHHHHFLLLLPTSFASKCSKSSRSPTRNLVILSRAPSSTLRTRLPGAMCLAAESGTDPCHRPSERVEREREEEEGVGSEVDGGRSKSSRICSSRREGQGQKQTKQKMKEQMREEKEKKEKGDDE